MLGLKSCAPKVGLSSDSAEGWVKVNDVLTSDYFKDMTKEILMKVLGSVIFSSWAVCQWQPGNSLALGCSAWQCLR